MSAAEDILPQIDYGSLNRTQKLALFLIVIGPEHAAQILKDFDEIETEQLCREIANFDIISEGIQQQVLEDFSEIIGSCLGAVLGGSRFAQKALGIAKGDYKAAALLGRIGPIGNSTEVISEIAEMDSRQIFNLIRNEQAQTIAFVMSHLTSQKASEILMMITPEQREGVVERIGIMTATKQENVNKVVRTIRKHVNPKDQTVTLQHSGGVRQVADLLNFIQKDVSKNLLAKIEERNPALGQAIQRKMFSFDDLIKLSARDLQRVMREIESNDLVIALKSANTRLQDVLLGAVSKRAAETLREEMSMLGPVRLKDVEGAQDRIIQAVRALEEEGEISLDQGGADVVS